MIDTNMNVLFTGMKTQKKEYFQSLLDGEHIVYDKQGKLLNIYAAFDIYYKKKKSTRELEFVKTNDAEKEEEEEKEGNEKKEKKLFRLDTLYEFINDLKPKSIVEKSNAEANKSDNEKIHEISLDLYKRGSKIANDNGLILVDTKYEFGYDSNGDITLIDEIHTPDSSRYFYLNTYDELLNKNQKQKQLSKEFFREWLMKNNFRGLEGQTIPEISDDVVEMVSSRYIELYEKLLGEKFIKPKSNNVLNQYDLPNTF